MQANQAWIAMFRRIPGDLQDTLALGLTTGSEIVVQKIIKLEPDFMMIRGRLAGTQDVGRIVLVPYSQLTFVAIQRFLKDQEVEAIFGKGAALDGVAMPQVADTPEAEELTVDEPAPPVNPIRRSGINSKTALLAKLRDRLKESPGKK